MACTALHSTPSPPPDTLLLATVETFGSVVPTRTAAKISGRSKSLLEKLRARGEGPVYYRHHRLIVYPVDRLLEWSRQDRA